MRWDFFEMGIFLREAHALRRATCFCRRRAQEGQALTATGRGSRDGSHPGLIANIHCALEGNTVTYLGTIIQFCHLFS